MCFSTGIPFRDMLYLVHTRILTAWSRKVS